MKLKIDDNEVELLLKDLRKLVHDAWESWIAKQVEETTPIRVKLVYGCGEWALGCAFGPAYKRMAYTEVHLMGWTADILYRSLINQIIETQTPEHAKAKKVEELSNKCGEFLDWLRDTKHYHLAGYHEHTEDCYGPEGHRTLLCGMSTHTLYRVNVHKPQLLFQFFGIDREKFECENDWLLALLREQANEVIR